MAERLLDTRKMSPKQLKSLEASLAKEPPIEIESIGCGVCKPFVIGQDEPLLNPKNKKKSG